MSGGATGQKSLKNNYLFDLISKMLALLVPLITIPYVSRVLGADNIGIYSYCLSIATYFTSLGCLGLDTYGQLGVARERDNPEKLNDFFWGSFLARLTMLLFSTALFVGMTLLIQQYRQIYVVLLIYIAGVMLDLTWSLAGLEMFKNLAYRNIIIKLIGLALIFLFVKTSGDLIIYIAIMQGATLVGNLTLWPCLKDIIKRPNFKNIHIAEHWKGSMPFFLLTLATSVFFLLNKSMLGWLVNIPAENGYYEQAYKMEQISLTLISSMIAVSLPRMTYYFGTAQHERMRQGIEKVMHFISMLAYPMMFGLMAVTNRLISVYLGQGFIKCATLLSIFAPLILIVGFSSSIGSLCLISQGKQRLFNRGAYLAAITNVIANLILIPKYASVGAAISMVISEIGALSVFLHYAKHEVTLSALFKMGWKNLLSAAVMGALLWFVGRGMPINAVSLLLQIAMGGAVYIAGLLILRDEYFLHYLRYGLEKLRGHKRA
jgi:O-antigen/teichoic acid export membrane protein